MDLQTVLTLLQLSATTFPGIADAIQKIIAAFNEADPAVLETLLAQANADADAQHQAAQS